MFKTKAFGMSVKAAGTGDLQDGQFEAIVSVFNNVDSYGDVVLPGAFDESLAEWAAKGDPIPVIWSHMWADPEAHVGEVLAAEARDDGLWVRGQILDREENRKAAQVWRLLKGRRVTQFSFAFDVEDGGWGEREDRDVYELRKLKLHEVGPCLLGVNRETELLAAKARELAARVRSGAGLDLKALADAHATIGQLLADTKTTEPSGSAAAGAAGGTEEETGQARPGAASDEKSREASPSTASPGLSPASVETLASLIETV